MARSERLATARQWFEKAERGFRAAGATEEAQRAAQLAGDLPCGLEKPL